MGQAAYMQSERLLYFRRVDELRWCRVRFFCDLHGNAFVQVNFHQQVLQLTPAADSPPGTNNWRLRFTDGTSAADLEAATLAS
jgi:hypothetical protein